MESLVARRNFEYINRVAFVENTKNKNLFTEDDFGKIKVDIFIKRSF
jgi:hypothetical protein